MTLPIISAYLAAILGLLQISLMLPVGLMRGKVGIGLGDGGDETLLYKIRRHANLTENAPIFLIALILLEVTGGPKMIVAGFAALFLIARLSHAYALSGPGKPKAVRPIGALGTILSIAGTSITLLWHLATAL